LDYGRGVAPQSLPAAIPSAGFCLRRQIRRLRHQTVRRSPHAVSPTRVREPGWLDLIRSSRASAIRAAN